MADCLIVIEDPNIAQVPDFASPRFNAVHNALVQAGRTVKEATQLLKTAWVAKNEHLRQLWAKQQVRDAQAVNPPHQQTPEKCPPQAEGKQHPPPHHNSPPPLECQHPPPTVTPTKCKVNPIARGLPISSVRKPWPAPLP